jgi:hypothetical protein
MRRITPHRAAAAALLVGAGLAQAPEARAAQDYVADVHTDASQPQDTQNVPLSAGQDYILGVNGTAGDVYLRDPQGKVVAHLPATHTLSYTFRAAYTASYQLSAKSGRTSSGDVGIVWGDLYTDCRADAKTLCTLKPNIGKLGYISDPADYDWYKVQLKKGQRYYFMSDVTSGEGFLTLRSPKGKLIKRVTVGGDVGIIEYRAPTTGTYFLATSFDPSRGAAAYSFELSYGPR